MQTEEKVRQALGEQRGALYNAVATQNEDTANECRLVIAWLEWVLGVDR
jgi:hypothetical protein